MLTNTKSCFYIIFIFCLLTLSGVFCKEYTRCEVAKTLSKNQFPRTFIPNWVCLAEASSGRSTSKITEYPNYKAFGMFQISSKEFCKIGKKGGECNMRCEDLLQDDITPSLACVKIVFARKGFDGWKGWSNKCKGKPLPDVSKCYDD